MNPIYLNHFNRWLTIKAGTLLHSVYSSAPHLIMFNAGSVIQTAGGVEAYGYFGLEMVETDAGICDVAIIAFLQIELDLLAKK